MMRERVKPFFDRMVLELAEVVVGSRVMICGVMIDLGRRLKRGCRAFPTDQARIKLQGATNARGHWIENTRTNRCSKAERFRSRVAAAQSTSPDTVGQTARIKTPNSMK